MESHIKLGKYLLNGKPYLDRLKELYRTQLPVGGQIDLYLVITRGKSLSFGKVGIEKACEILDDIVEKHKNIPKKYKRLLIGEYKEMEKEFEADKPKMEAEGLSVFEPPIHDEQVPIKVILSKDPAFVSYPDLNNYIDPIVKQEVQRGSREIFMEYGFNKDKAIDMLKGWAKCCLESKEYLDSSVVIVPLDFGTPIILHISRCEWVSYAVHIKKGEEDKLTDRLGEKYETALMGAEDK
jgi:hypothetical protein